MIQARKKSAGRAQNKLRSLARQSWHRGRIRALLVILLPALMLAGCGKKAPQLPIQPPPPPPTVVALSLAAGDNVNPNVQGRASPVAVSIFLLTSLAQFQQADLYQLLDDPESVLGAELIRMEQIVLAPGAEKSYVLQHDQEGWAVGAIAAFRDIDNAVWRATFTPAANTMNAVRGQVQGLSINLIGAGQKIVK